MEFRDFEATVKKFRPDVHVYPHGTFGNTEKNRKVAVIFNYGKPNESRVYEYYGSYSSILNRLHIPCMSKEEYNEMLVNLNSYRERNGQDSGFFGFTLDFSAEIAEYERRLNDIETGKLLVV